MDGCDIDLWEMYRDYIDGKREIAEKYNIRVTLLCDTKFHDDNWQLVRVCGSKKAFLWTYEKDARLCINVKVDPEWRELWRNKENM